jgi:putative transposase
MFENDDVQIASKIVGVASSAGYGWLKRWNDEGIKGLSPKFAGGKPSKLSEDRFQNIR